MCMGGGGSPKVEVPKPPPLPPPLPPPVPPKKSQQIQPKKLLEPGAKPDIRIGAAKVSPTSGRERRGSSLSIGSSGTNNQGLNL
jgi:hypothetical protein